KRHRQAALGQMQRDGRSDDPRAQHDRIGACHVLSFSTVPSAARPRGIDRPYRRRYQGRHAPPGGGVFPAMKALAALLSLVGRHGTLLAALSIFIGLLLPGLPPLLKPSLGTVIVIMLTLAFLRVDPVALKGHFRRPGLIAAAAVWLMLVSPALLGLLFHVLAVEQTLPGLYFILVLQISAPALMSAPAIAALLGLDVALTLATLIVSVAVTPVTASLFTHFFLGQALASPLALGVRLFLIISGSALVATVIRRLVGSGRLERQRERIDGLSVLSFVIFAIA